MQLISTWLFFTRGHLKRKSYFFFFFLWCYIQWMKLFLPQKERYFILARANISGYALHGGLREVEQEVILCWIAGVCETWSKSNFLFIFFPQCTVSCLLLKENSMFVLSIWQNIPFCVLRWLIVLICPLLLSVVLPKVLSGPWRLRAAH